MSHIVDVYPEIHRDFLYLVYEDGGVSKFDVSKSETTELWLKKFRAKFISFVFYQNEWCFAVSHLHGMLSFVKIETFERIKEISLSKKQFNFMFYCHQLNCLIFIKNRSVKLFDLETELMKFKLKIIKPCIASFFGDILFLGYEDGSIIRYKVAKWSLNFVEPEVMTNRTNWRLLRLTFRPIFTFRRRWT